MRYLAHSRTMNYELQQHKRCYAIHLDAVIAHILMTGAVCVCERESDWRGRGQLAAHCDCEVRGRECRQHTSCLIWQVKSPGAMPLSLSVDFILQLRLCRVGSICSHWCRLVSWFCHHITETRHLQLECQTYLCIVFVGLFRFKHKQRFYLVDCWTKSNQPSSH